METAKPTDDQLKVIHPEVERLIGILPADVDPMDIYYQAVMEKHGGSEPSSVTEP